MIGIVGGGIAGLSAAYRLQNHGFEVTVFESADDLGGLAATYPTAGDPIEKFYHHLSQSDQTIVELAGDLGLTDAIEWRYKSDGFYVEGLVHPMDTIWEIAAYPYLSLYDKFRLGMLTLEIDIRGGVPAFDTYTDFTAFEDTPVREFLLEHTTESVYEHFWEPLLDAKFGDRKTDVSAAWLLGRIKFRGDRDLLRGEQLGYFKGSFARLINALMDAVGHDSIETGATVRDIEFGPERPESLIVDSATGPEEYSVDGVVVATMPDVLETLTGYHCEIDFQGTICAVISLPAQLTDTYWLNFIDDAPFGVLLEHTNFIPPNRYGDEHLLYLASYIQDQNDRLWQMTNEEVREYWLDGLGELFPQFDPATVNWSRIARHPRTAPIYECGYLDMVIPYDLGDGVYYAGMASRAQYPERSLNGGIKAGFTCADRLANKH